MSHIGLTAAGSSVQQEPVVGTQRPQAAPITLDVDHARIQVTQPPPDSGSPRGRIGPTVAAVRAAPEFIRGMPKAELHVHHLGSAPPETLVRLARRSPHLPLPTDPALLADHFRIVDLTTFLAAYKSIVDLVRTPDDVYAVTIAIARRMAAQNIRYAEITVSPYSSVKRGVPAGAFVEALEAARSAAERTDAITLRWIFDIPSPEPEAAEQTLEIALGLQPPGLVALGLAGLETGRRRFEPHFRRARASGLRSVPHAGEALGPASVWDALGPLGADRVGHATSAVRDERLLDHLAARQVPVEVCLTSNLTTGVVRALADHPLRTMAERGLLVTVNTDDPTLFATDLSAEYLLAAGLLDLDEEGVARLARNAIQASFAPDPVRAALARELDAYVAAWPGSPQASGSAARVESSGGGQAP